MGAGEEGEMGEGFYMRRAMGRNEYSTRVYTVPSRELKHHHRAEGAHSTVHTDSTTSTMYNWGQ